MARRYAILGVEGPHDQAFVGRVLQLMGCEEFKGEQAKLDPFWARFVPTYPKSGRLYVRLDMPSILTKGDLSVAVYAGEGGRLKSQLAATVENHDPYQRDLFAFGIVADADQAGARSIAQGFARAFAPFYPGFPTAPGVVDASGCRTGIFVLPNNHDRGVLETLIVQCGEIVYPKHVSAARGFVDVFDVADTAHWRPFDKDKALVAGVASILRPGMTNTVTIKQDYWISTKSAAVLNGFISFLTALLEMA